MRIVCEALKDDCFDKSGRSDFYFNLDLETRKWVKRWLRLLKGKKKEADFMIFWLREKLALGEYK